MEYKREDIVKNTWGNSYYMPCEDCAIHQCSVCDFGICQALLKEMCGVDYCKFCVCRQENAGIIKCGIRVVPADFACFEPDYLAIYDTLSGDT